MDELCSKVENLQLNKGLLGSRSSFNNSGVEEKEDIEEQCVNDCTNIQEKDSAIAKKTYHNNWKKKLSGFKSATG
jgi:hypothetical protein